MKNRKKIAVQKGSRNVGDQLSFATMEFNNQEIVNSGANAYTYSRLNPFQTTFALRNTLNELIAGTQSETPGMRLVLGFSAQHLDLSKHNVPRDSKERIEEATTTTTTTTTTCSHNCLHHVH